MARTLFLDAIVIELVIVSDLRDNYHIYRACELVFPGLASSTVSWIHLDFCQFDPMAAVYLPRVEDMNAL